MKLLKIPKFCNGVTGSRLQHLVKVQAVARWPAPQGKYLMVVDVDLKGNVQAPRGVEMQPPHGGKYIL